VQSLQSDAIILLQYVAIHIFTKCCCFCADLKLKWNAQTRRITFTEAPAKYTSNTSATFRSNLTSAANGSGSSIDTCATLCSIRCKVGRHFVDALAADQVSRLASYFCTPLSSSCKPWELLLLLLQLHSQRFDKHFGLFMSPTCT